MAALILAVSASLYLFIPSPTLVETFVSSTGPHLHLWLSSKLLAFAGGGFSFSVIRKEIGAVVLQESADLLKLRLGKIPSWPLSEAAFS